MTSQKEQGNFAVVIPLVEIIISSLNTINQRLKRCMLKKTFLFRAKSAFSQELVPE